MLPKQANVYVLCLLVKPAFKCMLRINPRCTYDQNRKRLIIDTYYSQKKGNWILIAANMTGGKICSYR